MRNYASTNTIVSETKRLVRGVFDGRAWKRERKTWSLLGMAGMCAMLFWGTLAEPAHGAAVLVHDWTSAYAGNQYTYTNTSLSGSISGSSPVPGFAGQPGTYGLPYAITTQPALTDGFQIHGLSGVGNTMTFEFSSGYDWGNGGELVIGNIHNYYGYTMSAWDFNNDPIDVNSWSYLGEYASTAPGTSGYFSTSNTTLTAVGQSTFFSVVDPAVDMGHGQGGIVHLGGLSDVGRISLTLTTSSLGPNPQQVDFIIFNVGTVPEPSTALLLSLGLVGVVVCRRKV